MFLGSTGFPPRVRRGNPKSLEIDISKFLKMEKHMIKIGLLHTTIRGDEKLLIAAAKKMHVQLDLIDVRYEMFLPQKKYHYDVLLERCVSTVKGMYAIAYFESLGKLVVNKSTVASLCEDKFLTSLILYKHKVNTPKFAMAFDLAEVQKAIKVLGGYPVVIKPPLGSWGRLLAKVNDIDALEAILEHKQVLGTPPHGAFYLQAYVDKKGIDIRAFVIDGDVVCAIGRRSEHWITNTARGGKAENYTVTTDLKKICKKASDAVGGGILAIDLMETKDGYTVNEINHTMEFKNSEEPTGVSISGAIIDYCIKIVKDS